MAGTDLRLGFVGLGAMGAPMARHMAERLQAPVNVFDVRDAALEAACGWGGVACAAPREVAEKSDVVITMLPDDAAFSAVALGADGLITGAHDALIAVDFSTIGPWTMRDISKAFAEAGAVAFGGAATLGVGAAVEGRLTVYLDDEAVPFEKVAPVVGAFAETIVPTGPVGSAKVVKIVNNLMAGVNVAATAEAVALGAKAGIPAEVLIPLILKGSGTSYALDYHFRRRLLEGDIGPGTFPVDYMLKDLGLAVELGRRHDHTLFFGALAMAAYRGAAALGYEDYYFPVVLRWMERAAGMEALTPMPEAE